MRSRETTHARARPPWVAFNVSAQLVEQPDLVQIVLEACAAESVPPSQLCLEITERALMHATPDTRVALAQLRSAGAAIAIDDFGTGYASLTYLREFPATMLKIDRDFVGGVCSESQRRRHRGGRRRPRPRLGMTVTAEGVEEVAQQTALRALGCDHLQGFHFGAP